VLRVYTRHYSPCPHTESGYRKCRCPKWINGNLPTGKFIRVSANTRSWENAERKSRLMEANADPLCQAAPDASIRITIEESVRSFIEDEKARKLSKTTTCQSKDIV
jgi:integrase/recombinase XerD